MSLGVRRAAGLDVGQTATKLVVVEAARGGVPRVVKTAIFRNREEGILDVDEVRAYLANWLREQGVAALRFSLGLPQHMAMTNLADFPPSTAGKLEEMVAFEAQQLAGLTDEAFVNDYRRLAACHRYQNPVLMGVARETLVEQRLAMLRAAQVRVDHLFLEGEVLASVFARTQPALPAGPVLLLDVGAENTTLAITLAGQPLYLASFLFGGDFFSEALARHQGTSAPEAEKAKRQARLDPADEQSPLTRAARSFVVELEAALDNWRSHDPEAAKLRLEAIHLSGGGARLAGLREFIAQTYHCPVEVLAVPELSTTLGAEASTYSLAYGLACQGLDDSKRPGLLSLLPAVTRWQAVRRQRVGVLAAALVLLVLLLGGYFALSLYAVDRELASLTRESERLTSCQTVVPGVVDAQAKIEDCQRMLQPFAGRGNRGRRFVEAIQQFNEAKQPGDWLYLVADYPLSYRNLPDPLKLDTAAVKAGTPGPWALWERPAAGADSPETQVTVLAGSVVPWTGLAISGFTPRVRELQNINEMIRRLNASPLFAKVDANPRPSPLDMQSQKPWLMFSMRPFSLLCPFEEVEFDPTKTEAQAK